MSVCVDSLHLTVVATRAPQNYYINNIRTVLHDTSINIHMYSCTQRQTDRHIHIYFLRIDLQIRML